MDELVKDLRESAPKALAEADFDFVEGWLKEAADAIEKLAEDNAALNGTVSNLIQQIAELSKRVPKAPHGRLIDADALCDGRVSNDNVVICAKCAPTIIPAEEGE